MNPREVPVYNIEPMSERISASLTPRRLSMYVMLGFAMLSLALAVLGIYGVISYSTSQWTQEIGIRMALGADSRDPATIAAGVVALSGVALLASYTPARRAARIGPIEALRSE